MKSFKEKLNSDDEKAIKDVIAMLKKAIHGIENQIHRQHVRGDAHETERQ